MIKIKLILLSSPILPNMNKDLLSTSNTHSNYGRLKLTMVKSKDAFLYSMSMLTSLLFVKTNLTDYLSSLMSHCNLHCLPNQKTITQASKHCMVAPFPEIYFTFIVLLTFWPQVRYRFLPRAIPIRTLDACCCNRLFIWTVHALQTHLSQVAHLADQWVTTTDHQVCT